MPHLSKRPLSKETQNRLEKRLVVGLLNTHSATLRKVLLEILTNTEKLMLAKRLSLIFGIDKGIGTHDIASVIHMSSSTVSRFELAHENGKFKETSKWLAKPKGAEAVFNNLMKLFLIPFKVRQKGFRRTIQEIEDE